MCSTIIFASSGNELKMASAIRMLAPFDLNLNKDQLDLKHASGQMGFLRFCIPKPEKFRPEKKGYPFF